MKRNCAYTGKDSMCTDKVLPAEIAEQEIHNWTNKLPCSLEYKESKTDDFPTDMEAEIQETFYLLEIARWKVKFLEEKLKKLQSENNKRKPIKKTGVAKKNKEIKKQKEIEVAQTVKEIVSDNEDKIEEFLNQKKRSIF
jgi:hypothetical protein